MMAPLLWSCLLLSCCLVTCQDIEVSENQEKGVDQVSVSATWRAAPPKANRRGSENGDKYHLPRDCAEVAESGKNSSGVYRVWPDGWSPHGTEVYCDLENDGGGWTVVQRRGQFGNPKDYFYKRWRDYKFGFGNLTKEFWLGNEKLYRLSNQNNYALRVDLTDHQNNKLYAQYDEFFIEDENNKYKLWVDLYSGNAGDALKRQNGMFFTTKDRDNDRSPRNCAEEFKGAWWFQNCHDSHLNGLNHDGPYKSFADGINWEGLKDQSYSFRVVQIKIRPKF